MYKVLLAEDEMLVRIGLKNTINSASLGLEVIADVSDGKAALDVYNMQKPDLIITDIKMPVMDGIELIRSIREKDKDVKIIVLTCVEEFDLAQQAIKLKVSDYISKLNMKPREIENILSSIVNELDNERQGSKAGLHPHISISLMKENALKNLLWQRSNTEEEISSIIHSMKLRLSAVNLTMCVLFVNDYSKLVDRHDENRGNLIKMSILNILEEVLNAFNRGEVIHEHDGKYILIFGFEDTYSEQNIKYHLTEIFSRIGQMVMKYINCSVSFGVSSVKNGYVSLQELFEECYKTVDYIFFTYGDHHDLNIYWHDEIRQAHIIEQIKAIMNTTWKQVVMNIEDENFRVKILNETELLLKSEIYYKKNELKKFFVKCIRFSAYLSNFTEDRTTLSTNYENKIYGCCGLKECILCIKEFIEVLEARSVEEKVLSPEIARSVKLIKDSLCNNITLDQIAEKVNLSPNYLSMLFKKELDLSFVQYINQLRVKKAKTLLSDTDMKIYEVAESIGYNDESYFSRVFKRLTGVGPYEFRKKRVNI